MRGSRFPSISSQFRAADRRAEKRRRVDEAEAAGIVADSVEVRMAILARVEAGEITLQEAQAEIAKIKRTAKKNGKITRNQAYIRRRA